MILRLFKLVTCLCLTILNTSTASANAEGTSPTSFQPFEWNQDACYCKGKLDVSKLPAETATLIINGLESFQVTHSIPWTKLGEYSKNDLEEERDFYIDEHKTNIEKLQELKFPEIPTLLKYKQDRIFEEKIRYFLYISELNYLVTASSNHLEQELEGRSHLSQCNKYSNILSSDQNIRNALPSFIEERCMKNSDKKSCKSKMIRETTEIENAKIQVLMLGWHNCVNHFYREIQSPNHEEALKAVNQYTSNVTCECEESNC